MGKTALRLLGTASDVGPGTHTPALLAWSLVQAAEVDVVALLGLAAALRRAGLVGVELLRLLVVGSAPEPGAAAHEQAGRHQHDRESAPHHGAAEAMRHAIGCPPAN